MSSPSTVRRFGTAKTYGRTRETTAARAFDEVVSGKTPPIKAETKWGKTNFMAIRDDQKAKLDVPEIKEAKPKIDEDPFSFETEDHRKVSPTKPQRVLVTPDAQRAVTKLPASRIVTQVKPSQVALAPVQPPAESGAESALPGAIARPGKTYTRAQEGRMSTAGRQQLIMDQFMEVGKTVRTESGIEVVYTTRPQSPRAAWQVSPTDNSTPIVTQEETPPAPRVRPQPALLPTVSPAKEGESKDRVTYNIDDDDDDDDDIFPATFRREPLKTYSGEIITPIISVPDSPPPAKKRRKPTGAPRGRRTSRYTDPTLIEEYRKRYQETHAQMRDQTAGMNNSTVVSSKELRGTQGTTLVVVCKPKVEVPEKKDDVQTKYFKNVKKELDKADKNISESDSQGDVKAETTDSDASPVKTPTTRSALASPQGSGSSASTPTRNLRVRFADQSDTSPASSSSKSSAAPSPAKKPRASTTVPASNLKGKDKPGAAVPGAAAKTVTVSNDSSNSVASRTRSGGRQYRIFKSRGPPTAPATTKEAKNEHEMEAADSPQMPELTPELPTTSTSGSATDNPPNITDEEEEAMDTSAASSLETSREAPKTDSQASKATNETVSDSQKSDASVEIVDTPSPSHHARNTDSRDTPSPSEMSDDSQELPQEMSSSQDNSQKEESSTTSTAPRRFFKSKKASSASSLQRKVFEKSPSKASYNARSWHQDQAEKESEGLPGPASKAKKAASGDTDASQTVGDAPKLTRKVHWPSEKHEEAYTSVRVNKEHKELFTVVHNVKQAHEVQESGETQDFMDDIEYLLDSLCDDKPSSIRALSTIQLAGKCIMPAFRMHLRAHGTVTTIFSLLHDACSDPALALSTAAMMFMLSRDRLNMDLDKESLHLMLKLNEVDMPRSNDQAMEEAAVAAPTAEEEGTLEKCRQRVKDLLVQLQRETKAKQIDLGIDFVSTGNLAMESLLSLTSRRAGEWFKEELRQLGGLDHFVETIHHCGSEIKEDLAANFDKYLPSLKKLDRCLRVLENITFMNSDNQQYLIAYNRGLLISSTCRILQQCVECLPSNPPSELGAEHAKDQIGWTIFNTLLSILRVLLNITHDSEFGSTRVGEEDGLMKAVLMCVVSTQWYVPSEQRFDLLVLSLGLLINLMEHCGVNRRHLVEAKVEACVREEDKPTNMDAVEALVKLFLQRENAARQMEEAPDTPSKECESPNKSGEWRESDSGIEWIAKSAEKVKAAEKEQRNAREKAAEGGATPSHGSETANQDGTDKPIDGASILEDEETFTKALHKAGKHMENSIVASYVGLLLGCFIQDNRKYVEVVKQHLPDGSFESMIKILKKFLGFMNLTTAIGTTDANSIQRVIETLEAC